MYNYKIRKRFKFIGGMFPLPNILKRIKKRICGMNHDPTANLDSTRARRHPIDPHQNKIIKLSNSYVNHPISVSLFRCVNYTYMGVYNSI